MASWTKKLKNVRKNKKRPNKGNLKADKRRIEENAEKLRQAAV